MVSEQLVEKFCQAIANAEGFGPAEALPTRCNNPGDLTDDGDIGLGTARSKGIGAANITIYRTADDGWNALRNKVRRMLEGRSKVYFLWMTIDMVGQVYARDRDWAINVARELDVPVTTVIGDLVANYEEQHA